MTDLWEQPPQFHENSRSGQNGTMANRHDGNAEMTTHVHEAFVGPDSFCCPHCHGPLRFAIVSAASNNVRHDDVLSRAERPVLETQVQDEIGNEPLEATMRRAILNAIKRTGNSEKAAKVLGIGKTTVYRKLREYRLADVQLAKQ